MTGGGREGGRDAISTTWVFYIYAAQNNNMCTDIRGLHTFYGKIKQILPWYARSQFRRYS